MINNPTKYPRISDFITKEKNTYMKCKCGQLATMQVIVQVNCFRGDDDLVWVCDAHATIGNVKRLYFTIP